MREGEGAKLKCCLPGILMGNRLARGVMLLYVHKRNDRGVCGGSN